MDGLEDSEAAGPVTMQQIRERHQRKRKEAPKYLAEHGVKRIKILKAVVAPQSVSIKDIRGSDEEVARRIELIYANGRL